MGQRRVLVIGTQCDKQGKLDCLPGHAEALYEALIDPETGGCVSALKNEKGLLLGACPRISPGFPLDSLGPAICYNSCL